MIDNFFNLYLEIHILSINSLSWILLNVDIYIYIYKPHQLIIHETTINAKYLILLIYPQSWMIHFS